MSTRRTSSPASVHISRRSWPHQQALRRLSISGIVDSISPIVTKGCRAAVVGVPVHGVFCASTSLVIIWFFLLRLRKQRANLAAHFASKTNFSGLLGQRVRLIQRLFRRGCSEMPDNAGRVQDLRRNAVEHNHFSALAARHQADDTKVDTKSYKSLDCDVKMFFDLYYNHSVTRAQELSTLPGLEHRRRFRRAIKCCRPQLNLLASHLAGSRGHGRHRMPHKLAWLGCATAHSFIDPRYVPRTQAGEAGKDRRVLKNIQREGCPFSRRPA